jgi:peptidoglycan/xylan/chitin deacetylase (PgdA/CDA1 family)
MAARARERGVRIIGATILPFGGSTFYHPDIATERDRQAVNAWIRKPGSFDSVIDFDALMRDPAHPARLRKDLDSGDGLHPSIAGYAAMGNAVPLSLFAGLTDPELAITFDDLPVHGPLPAGETRAEVIRSIAATLKDAGAPDVYGFVNGASVADDPSLQAGLDAWRSAGYPLGNHSWSHPNLNSTATRDYLIDIARNEDTLARTMETADWRWYRFPFLAEGEGAKRTKVRRFLAQRGYRIAGVTMSFDDYLWNEPYARCLVRGDQASVAALEQSYLEAARGSISYSRRASHALYGRDIPYVLLMHVGAFDAHMLPQLLAVYRAEGFRFVTLPAASADPAYASDVNPAARPEPGGLSERLKAADLELTPPPSYAETLDRMCR